MKQLHLDSLILTLLFLFAQNTLSICYNEKGKRVSWFSAIQLPKSNKNSSQNKMLFFDDKSTEFRVVDSNTIVGKLFSQIDRKEDNYAAWNDHTEDKKASSSQAHAKGVLFYTKTFTKGFFLMHSIPLFPNFPEIFDSVEKGWEKSSYGQNLFCVSLNKGKSTAVKILEFLEDQNSFFYENNFKLETIEKRQTKAVKKITNAGATKITSITRTETVEKTTRVSKRKRRSVNGTKNSKGKKKLILEKAPKKRKPKRAKKLALARILQKTAIRQSKPKKRVRRNRKNVPKNLEALKLTPEITIYTKHSTSKFAPWTNLSKVLETGFIIESWGRPYTPSVCTSGEAQRRIINTRWLQYGDIKWKCSQDHSKWGLAIQKPIFCSSDLNNMASQSNRGGSMLCLENQKLYEAYANLIKTTKCEKNFEKFDDNSRGGWDIIDSAKKGKLN